MKQFEAAYKQLNLAQKQAVDIIEGPVLVVAGPGTGKTQILSLRAANIIRQTDADPANIICLTFTDKAALNMRQRLQELIGREARDISAKTFHAFAAEIMNNYPDYFWEGAKLSTAPDAVQLDIVESILAKLPLDNPLSANFAGNYTAIGDVMQSLKLAKEAGLTPEELRAVIQTNLEYIDVIEPSLVDILSPPLSIKSINKLSSAIQKLPPQQIDHITALQPLDQIIKLSLASAIEADSGTGKTAATGKWKLRWVQTINGVKSMSKERARNSWWLSIADIYEEYRKVLHQRGFYDYSDMLIEVITQLKHNPDMLADLQERYQYVMIDEFQDTNSAQMQLAKLIADHYANNGKPNLMAVGDDDQSIFAFNGAEINNMLDFQAAYPTTKLIVLTDNYRSSQSVLDFARTVIEQAGDRLTDRQRDLTKRLEAKNPPEANSEIVHLSYPTSKHQYSLLAEEVSKLWADKQTSIAILARKHSSLQQIAKFLLDKNIPIRYDQQTNILEHPAVEQICLIAKTIDAISQGDKTQTNAYLAIILRHPAWQISSKALWQISIENYSSPDWLATLLDSADNNLSTIGNWLVWLSRQSTELPLALVFEIIIGLEPGEYLTSPLRKFYLSDEELSSEYLETISAISILRSLTSEFSSKNPSLADFVRFIDLHLATGRVISDESWFNGGGSAVQLLTVYKAKGLEFEHVYVLDLIEKMWSPRNIGRGSPANLKLKSYGEKYDDYVRLLYVAATRAKRNITLASYSTDDYGKEILPTPLIAEVKTEQVHDTNIKEIDILEQNLQWPRLNARDEFSLLRERLEKYTLSPTALIDFLNLERAGPQSFVERHLLHVPHPRSPEGSYGTAIHSAMETAQRLVNLKGKVQLETILDRFEHTLKEEHMNPNDFTKYFKQGLGLLEKLFANDNFILHPGGLSEQKISQIELDKAVLNGKIDLIDVDDNEIVISDYKTGKPLSSLDTKDKTKMTKAWRHKTQLIFYALLVQNSPRFKKAASISTRMLYLESDDIRKVQLAYQPTKDDIVRLELLVNKVWAKIISLNFPDTSSYSQDITGILQFEQDLLEDKI